MFEEHKQIIFSTEQAYEQVIVPNQSRILPVSLSEPRIITLYLTHVRSTLTHSIKPSILISCLANNWKISSESAPKGGVQYLQDYIRVHQRVWGVMLINLLMLSSMIGQRIPLSKLQILEDTASPLKRKVKVFARNLPEDFFLRRTPLHSQRSALTPARNHVHTHNEPRRTGAVEREASGCEVVARRQGLSARGGGEEASTLSLLMGIISSTREIRKSIRKHSLELKKDSRLDGNNENMRVELPPLLLRKGVTSHF